MDKERIFFLVSESRILAFASTPDAEIFLEEARNAILTGDRTIKVIEFEFSVGLPESPEEGTIAMMFKNEEDIMENAALMEAFHENKLERQKEVWDSMPEGIYRLKKGRYGGAERAVSIEFCPDIGEENWNRIESAGWSRPKSKQDS